MNFAFHMIQKEDFFRSDFTWDSHELIFHWKVVWKKLSLQTLKLFILV